MMEQDEAFKKLVETAEELLKRTKKNDPHMDEVKALLLGADAIKEMANSNEEAFDCTDHVDRLDRLWEKVFKP